MGQQLNWDRLGARCIYSGHSSVEDVMDALKALYASAAFAHTRFVIHDFSASRQIAPGVAATATIGASGLNPGAPNPHLRTAIVTTDQHLQYMLQGYQKLSRSCFRSFSTLAAAESWARQEHIALA